MTAVPGTTGSIVPPARRQRGTATDARRARESPRAPRTYINRELSWLEYSARVLHEAGDPRNPLLERVRFLTIFAGMLDEFFQIRMSGLRQQVAAGSLALSPDGRTAGEQLAAARARVLELVAELSAIYLELRKALGSAGVELVKYSSIPEHHETLRRRFLDEIFPVLTPLAVDPGHPFPYISTLSLSIAVGLRDPATGERRFARVKVPPILGRLMEVEPNRFVLATACGLAGFAFGALMDMYQWTLAAEHTLASYLAVSATSLTFNIAHAVGNVAFALLHPALVSQQSVHDRLRHLAPIRRIENLPPFHRMRHETGFDEHRGHHRIAQDARHTGFV